MADVRRRKEEFSISGGEILAALRALLRSATTRRIAFKTRAGRVFLRIPLLLGIAGFILLPLWCVAALLIALVLRLRIALERVDAFAAEPVAPNGAPS